MKITKIALALAVINLSATAFAGMPDNSIPVPVAPAGMNLFEPPSSGAWSFGLEAMYVQPISNEFNAAQIVTDDDTTGFVVNYRNNTVHNNWEWGGTLDATYLFEGYSRDMKLAWTHMFSTTNSNHTSPGTDQYVQPSLGGSEFGPAFIGSISSSGYEATNSTGVIKGVAKTDYDAVDLVFGQWFKDGNRVDLHLLGGLRWGEINTSFKDHRNTTNESVGISGDVIGNTRSIQDLGVNKITSNFDGLGPRAGIDTVVHLNPSFSIVGSFAGSLLIGSINSKYSSNEVVYTTVNTGAAVTTTAVSGPFNGKNTHNNTRVVPELDARLGLDYLHAFTASTSMNVQVGYLVTNYFNVTEADLVSDGLVASGGSFANPTSNRENWGYQGPYVRAQVNLT